MESVLGILLHKLYALSLDVRPEVSRAATMLSDIGRGHMVFLLLLSCPVLSLPLRSATVR